ncbi:hypothetical protein DH2020_032565 [Rehmannia glutinosa]|uniref:Protein kinase domain-containing protein n=1 Tax=Rehmannia glutinosa TaxID=99300 RepID=A0ABR0VEN7_REHGL
MSASEGSSGHSAGGDASTAVHDGDGESEEEREGACEQDVSNSVARAPERYGGVDELADASRLKRVIRLLNLKPLADAEGAKRSGMIELLRSNGGLSYTCTAPLPNKCDWEIEPAELDFSNSTLVGKGSFGEIVKACWRGTPVAVKRILPSLSDDRLVIQDFRHEVNLLVKLRRSTSASEGKRALNPSTAINFALDIARGMAYLHSEPNVIIHRDLKPRNVLLVNTNADHLKVGDFGLSKLIRVQHSHDVYKMTGETGSYRYMAPEVFKHRKYDKKVDVFSFAMILYEMLEGEPPMSHYEPYEAARYVAEGHRPMFRAKGFIPELRELTGQCWSADMNETFVLGNFEETRKINQGSVTVRSSLAHLYRKLSNPIVASEGC